MKQKSIWGRGGCSLLLLITVLLALAATARAKGTAPKTAKVTSRIHAAVSSLDHDLLMRIEANQKTLQRQLLILNAASEHSAGQLNRRMDSLTDQLQQVLFTEKSSGHTQLLTIIQSTRRLLGFIVGFLALLCGAGLFFGMRLRKSGLLRSANKEVRKETPDAGLEAQWKVTS
jgi:chromatin segregation and condensation protein Rec8/ScpA/Scc1 (kleisin family)